MTIEYKIANNKEVFNKMKEMFEDHHKELSVTKGFPLNPDYKVYEEANNRNSLKIALCLKDDEIIGYIVYFVGINLHYKSCLLATEDIYYLKPEYRKGLIGVKMFVFAENYLKSIGVNMVRYSTKTHLDNSKLFEFLGCNFVEKVYTKEFK
jgi:hypothetical protein